MRSVRKEDKSLLPSWPPLTKFVLSLLMKEASELVEIKLDSLAIHRQDKNLQLAFAKAQSLCDGSISV